MESTMAIMNESNLPANILVIPNPLLFHRIKATGFMNPRWI